MARSIHCTVIEVPAMSDSLDENLAGGLQELLPWADPYIAALIEKLRSSAEFGEAHGELSPPLESDNPAGDDAWQADWSPRNWPREG
jgi:hypothetical protein